MSRHGTTSGIALPARTTARGDVYVVGVSRGDEYEDRRDYRRGDSVQTKVDLIDGFVPNGLVAPVCDLSPSPVTPPRTNSSSKMSYSPPPRNSFPTPQPQPQALPQSSQEDGEIFSPPPPKAPPLAPRSHTPPTHPRSFYTARGDISPTPCSGGVLHLISCSVFSR